jgi:hypothetical protein
MAAPGRQQTLDIPKFSLPRRAPLAREAPRLTYRCAGGAKEYQPFRDC